MKEEYKRHEPKVFGVTPSMEERLVNSMEERLVNSMEERLVNSMIQQGHSIIQPMAPAAAI